MLGSRRHIEELRQASAELHEALERAEEKIRFLESELRAVQAASNTRDQFARDEIRHLLDLLAAERGSPSSSPDNMTVWKAQMEALGEGEKSSHGSSPAEQDSALPTAGLLERLNQIWNDGWTPPGGWQTPATHPLQLEAEETDDSEPQEAG